jgi:hypothetical protein
MKELQKRKRSKAQIASAEGLSIEEGHTLVQSRNQVEEAIQTGLHYRNRTHQTHCSAAYGRPHAAVTVILSGIKDCSVLIMVIISFYIEMHVLLY